MGWIYIVVRTFPFWAIPMGFAMIGGWIQNKRKNRVGKFGHALLFVGIVFIAISAVFLMKQGHMTAVPFFHRLLNPQSME